MNMQHSKRDEVKTQHSEEKQGENNTPKKNPKSEKGSVSDGVDNSAEELRKEIELKNKRISEQAKGVQQVLDENKTLKAKLESVSNVPSAEEVLKMVKSNNPDFDEMDSKEQKRAISDEVARTKQEMNQKKLESKLHDLEYKDQVNEVIDSDPKLREHSSDFRKFANKYKGQNLELLKKAFMHDTTPKETSHKGLERSNIDRHRLPQKKEKLSKDEISQMQVDAMSYGEKAAKGEISLEDIDD